MSAKPQSAATKRRLKKLSEKPALASMRWPTQELRVAAFARLCTHLKSGYSLQSFTEADEDTVYRYLRDYPEDFIKEDFIEARRANVKFWEGLGIGGVTGKLKGFSAPAWIFNMKNRANWTDKVEQIVKDGGKVKTAPPEPGKATETYLAETKGGKSDVAG